MSPDGRVPSVPQNQPGCTVALFSKPQLHWPPIVWCQGLMFHPWAALCVLCAGPQHQGPQHEGLLTPPRSSRPLSPHQGQQSGRPLLGCWPGPLRQWTQWGECLQLPVTRAGGLAWGHLRQALGVGGNCWAGGCAPGCLPALLPGSSRGGVHGRVSGSKGQILQHTALGSVTLFPLMWPLLEQTPSLLVPPAPPGPSEVCAC